MDGPTRLKVKQRSPLGHRREDGRHCPVLVDVAHEIETSELVPLGPIPAVVGLQLFDLIDPTRVNALEAISAGTEPILTTLHAGESCSVGGTTSSLKNELPNQVVQCSSQVVEHVTEDEGQFDRWVRIHLPDSPEREWRFRVELVGSRVRTSFQELIEAPLEMVRVTASAVELGLDDGEIAAHSLSDWALYAATEDGA